MEVHWPLVWKFENEKLVHCQDWEPSQVDVAQLTTNPHHVPIKRQKQVLHTQFASIVVMLGFSYSNAKIS